MLSTVRNNSLAVAFGFRFCFFIFFIVTSERHNLPVAVRQRSDLVSKWLQCILGTSQRLS
jgi:hypothetical protein